MSETNDATVRTGPYAALVNGTYYAASKKKPYDRVLVQLEFAFPPDGAWGDAYRFACALLVPGRYFVLQEVEPAETGQRDGEPRP